MITRRLQKLLDEIENESVRSALRSAHKAITDGAVETIAQHIVETQRGRNAACFAANGLRAGLERERRRVCRWSEEAMHQRELVAQAVAVETV